MQKEKSSHSFYRWLSCCFIAGFIFSIPFISYASPPKNIGITFFKNMTGRHGLEQTLMTAMLSDISQNPKFHIIDRINLGDILNEQGLSRTGIVDKSSSVQMGRINGISYLIAGTVLETYSTLLSDHKKPTVGVSVFWEVINTTSGTVVLADTTMGSVDKILVKGKDRQKTWLMPPGAYASAIQDASAKICTELDKKLNAPPLTVHIASIYGNTVYLDAGTNKQILPGQIFMVYQEGASIRHPITGEVLGKESKLLCKIMLNNVENKISSGVIIDGDLHNVKIGDNVVRQ
jgi:hypothetical protein